MQHANRLIKQRGAAIVVVALIAVPLLGAVGFAIESGLGYGVKSKLNAAVDAAAIAGARAVANGANDSERQANAQLAGERYFAANFPSGLMGATPNTPTVTASHHPDGFWTINVSAAATVPTTFMRLLGYDQLTVGASAEVIRRDLDMMLVIDSSGSMGNPSDAFDDVQDAAATFVDLFNEGSGGDRIGLVSYASGADVDVPINKDADRGFDKTQIVNAINALSPGGYTTSEWAMQQAYSELQAIPPALRSSLRVIVFFSDGAPNTVAAEFIRLGNPVTGSLASGTSPPPNFRAEPFYNHLDQENYLGPWGNDIPELPDTGLGNVPLASYNDARSFSPLALPIENTRCNVNKAARNMVENVANNARDEGIYVYTLGFNGSARLSQQEVPFCGYGPEELGANILERLANTTAADISNADQPRGLTIIFDNSDEAEAAFNQVASAILRLTR